MSPLLGTFVAGPANYLDLGAGAGIIPSVMALAGVNVTAVDTWEEYEAGFDNQMGECENLLARLKQSGVKCVDHNILQAPLPFASGSFDVVSMLAVLEHLPRPLTVLQEVTRLLRPGGLLIVTVPNTANLRNRIRLLVGRSPHPDDISVWLSPTFFGHFREMTLEEVTYIFERFGFSTVAAEHTNACHWNTRYPDGRWGKTYRFNSAHQWLKALYLAITEMFPGFRYELFAVGKKVEITPDVRTSEG
jgi:SAM-dependent methyltransferase